jgi:hypothetical protein
MRVNNRPVTRAVTTCPSGNRVAPKVYQEAGGPTPDEETLEEEDAMAIVGKDDAAAYPHLLVSGWALDRVLDHLRADSVVGRSLQVDQPGGRLAHVRLGPEADDEFVRGVIQSLPVELRTRVYANDALEVPAPSMGALPQDLVGRDAALPARALSARRESNDGAGVTIGVVDTGMWPHPWCAGAYLAHVQDLEVENSPYDPKKARCAGHGTFVTGLVLQQAPAADVRVVRALDPSGHGRTAAVVAAVEQLAEQGVDIINLSLGSARPTVGEASLLTDTIRGLGRRTVVVAAAGNRDPGEPPQAFLPAALPEVVAVGAAVESSAGCWRWADYSNFGPWVDLAAAGDEVVSTFPVFPANGSPAAGAGAFAGWAKWAGTSFATAIVSGQLAHVMTSGQERVDAFTAAGFLRQRATARTADDLRVPVIPRQPWELQASPTPAGELAGATR